MEEVMSREPYIEQAMVSLNQMLMEYNASRPDDPDFQIVITGEDDNPFRFDDLRTKEFIDLETSDPATIVSIIDIDE